MQEFYSILLQMGETLKRYRTPLMADLTSLQRDVLY